ncbi:MAG: hypothetical protein L3J21_09515, partial [Devosiaceae bacterium]|nr:hypothetical protein [Devosiaceae bacterium]
GAWLNYGKNVQGGNKILLGRCESDPSFREGLQYSILETLGNLATNRDGLNAEQRWKRKLGKKATTLNAN